MQLKPLTFKSNREYMNVDCLLNSFEVKFRNQLQSKHFFLTDRKKLVESRKESFIMEINLKFPEMDPSKMDKLFCNPVVSGRTKMPSALAASEYSCEFGSYKFYGICGLGGLLSCGLTHILVTPLDLVKCRMQVISLAKPNLLQVGRPFTTISNENECHF